MDAAPAQAKTPIVQMEEVTVGSLRDQSVVVAEGVNWQVRPGEFWAIAGLQGSGKSDFLMLTGGLMAPVQGRYWLFGEQMPIFEEGRLKQRLRLGLVFDGGQLFNHLTVSENIALPLRYHHNLSRAEAEPQVQAMLAAMKLEEWADSTPGAIGRNWQKRAGLARALMLKPEILLVDNPLGGLDLPHASWWLEMLGQLAQGHPCLDHRPLTLVVTTADLRRWQGLARQFAILRHHRFAVLGSWPQLENTNEELLRGLFLD